MAHSHPNQHTLPHTPPPLQSSQIYSPALLPLIPQLISSNILVPYASPRLPLIPRSIHPSLRKDSDQDRLPSPSSQGVSLTAGYRVIESAPKVVLSFRVLSDQHEQKSPPYAQQKTPQEQIDIQQRKINANQTKNVAKNFGKAILAFVKHNKKMFRVICKKTSTPYQRVIQELHLLKKEMTTVLGFRKVWSDHKYSACMRIVSNIFLKRASLNYIFKSKLSNIHTHIKYRHRFLEALQKPQEFTHLKKIVGN